MLRRVIRLKPETSDDLRKPLGAPAAPPAGAAPGGMRVSSMLAGGAICALAMVAGWGVFQSAGHRGQRVEVASGGKPPVANPDNTPAAAPVETETDSAATGSIDPPPGSYRSTGAEIENSSGVRVVRIGEGEERETPGAMVIRMPQAPSISLTTAPDRRISENGKHGLLPKLGPGGAAAREIYARPFVTSANVSTGAPRIAIVIGGMGLSQNATRNAISKLPPEVTLGFAPYGQGLPGQVAFARSRGHEVILQAPMEAIGIGEAPGPYMPNTGDIAAQTIDHLHWLMSRFPGYTGVANFLGARFLGDAGALAPVMNEIGQRGLFFFDDGTSPASVARNLATSLSVPFVRGDVVIDAQRDAKSIEAALNRLEILARERGSAIGSASALPDSVNRIAAFAKALERRGIALAPLSALAASPAASARAP